MAAVKEIIVANFSGGRSSAMCLRESLRAGVKFHHVLFANTGLESPETYAFVRWVNDHVHPVTCLEYVRGRAYAVVGISDLSRAGEPMTAMVADKQYLPNRMTRICTEALKIRPLMNHVYDEHGQDVAVRAYVGFRADESRQRLARLRARNEAFEARLAAGKRPLKYTNAMETPLIDRGVRRADVLEYWQEVAPDVPFPIGDESTRLSNCIGCFYSNTAEKVRVARDHTWFADYWDNLERSMDGTAKAGMPPRRRLWMIRNLNRQPTAADEGRRSVIPEHTWSDIKELAGKPSLLPHDDVADGAYVGGCDDGYCNTD